MTCDNEYTMIGEGSITIEFDKDSEQYKTIMDVLRRTEPTMFDNEYKERAYQWYSLAVDRDDISTSGIEAVCLILDERWSVLGQSFLERYEADHDSLEKIRKNAEGLANWMDTKREGDVLVRTVNNLIDRTIAVMERE